MHCDAHEKNTQDLAAQRSALTTIKWVIGVGMPVATAICGLLFSGVSAQLEKIQTEIKTLNSNLQATLVVNAKYDVEVQQMRRDIDDLREHVKRTER